MEAKIQQFRVEITTRTILKILIILVGVYFAWQLRGVFFMLFFSFILYSAFTPIVDFLEKKKMPRWLAILIIYLSVFITISLVLVVGANVLIDQAQKLSNDLDNIISSFLRALEKVFPWLRDRINPDEVAKELTQGSDLTHTLFSSDSISSAFGVLSSVATVGITIFAVIMVSIYMLNRKEKFYAGALQYLPKVDQNKFMKLMRKIEVGLGSWFLGELVLMVVVGFVTWVGISLPGLFFEHYTLDSYALPIALIAGLLEAVPNIGPTLTVVLALFIAVGSGDLSTTELTVATLIQSLYVVVLGTIIQNLEAVFLVPTVMKKAVGVDPIVTILGIIGALSLFGIVGALIIVPVIATINIIINFYRDESSN